MTSTPSPRAAPGETRRIADVLLWPLGWLLGLANANPGVYRRDFYAMKDRILWRFGRQCGEDVQRIVRECWGSDDQIGCEGATCRRCGGTGAWDTSLILLQRWTLGGRIFHRPDRRVYGDGWHVSIEGRIQHRVNFRAANEARLWLALCFDRALWWRLMTCSEMCAWQWRPMLALQRLTFRCATFARRFRFRHCFYCDRRFLRPFGGYSFACDRCAHSYAEVDGDLPF